jgi:hypothetical protein
MGVGLLALARYTLNGPYQAAAVVGLLAVLAVFIPPMLGSSMLAVLIGSMCMMLSCILVSLIILTQGSISGLKAILVSVLGITLVGWTLVNSPSLGLWIGLVQWLPIILLSQSLRSTKSLALTIMAGVGLGAIAIVAQQLLIGPLENDLVAQVFQSMGEAGQESPELPQATLELLRLFVLAMVATAYLFIMLILFVARWLQASLAGTNGFGEEFRALTLGKTAAAVALIMVGLSFWLQQDWLASMVFLLVIAFMFQGLAVVHSKLGPNRHGRLMLSVCYVMLLIIKQAVALIAVTGLIDNWLVFRKKAVKPGNENED